MLELFGQRQQDLLRLLLKHPDGLSMDELAQRLSITRPAVRQHLAALEGDGFVQRGASRKTAGRPGQTYGLTARGAELFPRQYSWFTSLLLNAVKAERGSEGLSAWLVEIAEAIAKSLAPRFEGKSEQERLAEIVTIMDELAYEARQEAASRPGGGDIVASNCVYHNLAREFPEVCQFDLALVARLSGKAVTHGECMVRGGGVCRFSLSDPPRG